MDVLDTACARVKVSLGARPAALEALEDELTAVRRELAALERDSRQGAVPDNAGENAARHAALQGKVAELTSRIEDITVRWNREKRLVEAILAKRAAAASELVCDPGMAEDDKDKAAGSGMGSLEEKGGAPPWPN